MPRQKFRTISIPETLYNQIKRFLQNSEHGYTNIPDFIRDAIREKLSTLQNMGKNLKEASK
jgi:metal-responsive CopG/Arc/MetJ family transcriptional regulator